VPTGRVDRSSSYRFRRHALVVLCTYTSWRPNFAGRRAIYISRYIHSMVPRAEEIICGFTGRGRRECALVMRLCGKARVATGPTAGKNVNCWKRGRKMTNLSSTILRRFGCIAYRRTSNGSKDRYQDASAYSKPVRDAGLRPRSITNRKDLENMGSSASESHKLLRCRVRQGSNGSYTMH